MKYLLYFFIGVCFCGQILVLSQNGFTKNALLGIFHSNDSVEIGEGDDLGTGFGTGLGSGSGCCQTSSGECRTDMSMIDCQTQGGTFTADGVCENGSCVTKIGCCKLRMSDECMEGVSMRFCIESGGTFTEGAVCRNDSCVMEIGCCETAPGSCRGGVTADYCKILNGTFTAGAVCENGSCVMTNGCCETAGGGCLSDVSMFQCQEYDGIFTPGGVCKDGKCVIANGCCLLPWGGCDNTTSTMCLQFGGSFTADGVCQGDTCVAADEVLGCCKRFGFDCIGGVTKSECTAHLGEFTPSGVCRDGDCVPDDGSGEGSDDTFGCCQVFPDDCQEGISRSTCFQLGGSFTAGGVCRNGICVLDFGLGTGLDTDGDGIPDDEDDTPFSGSDDSSGSGLDTDGDGIPDSIDYNMPFSGSGTAKQENSVQVGLVSTRIYPNPNNGIFTLAVTHNASEAMTIEVMDISGRQLYCAQATTVLGTYERNIDLSGLQSGLYLLRTTVGQQNVVQKLIVY